MRWGEKNIQNGRYREKRERVRDRKRQTEVNNRRTTAKSDVVKLKLIIYHN